MSGFIQIGVTALRDPGTGEYLPSVPLYIRAEDEGKVAAPVFDRELLEGLTEKYRAFRKAERKEKRIRIHADPEKEGGC